MWTSLNYSLCKGYRDENGRAKGRAVIEMENGDTISGL